MRIPTRFGWVALVLTLGTASTAWGRDDLAGAYGGGLSTDLTGATGIHGTYWVTDDIGATATLGLLSIAPKADGADNVTAFLIGAGGIYNFYKREKVHLGATVSLGFGAADAGFFRLGIGARPELFVQDWLSLHTTLGFLATFVNDNSAFLPEGSYMTLGKGAVFGGFGATFYFGGRSSTETTTEPDDGGYDFDF